MDGWLIFFRIVHVGTAMMWFGGAIIGGFFVQPTAKALGPASQPFMDYLMKRRGMGIFFPIVAALTILAGAVLYWHDSGGLQAAWITSPTGLAYTIGGLAARSNDPAVARLTSGCFVEPALRAYGPSATEDMAQSAN